MKLEILYLSLKDIQGLSVPVGQIVGWVEEALRLKGLGKTEMPPKPGIHTMPDAFIHAMPAYLPDLKAAGMKWVSGYPDNFKKGLPYISGLLILNDPETGIPIAVMDCTWITAMRTGAVTAVAAKYLARPDASVIGIIGCGVQGRSNLEALAAVLKKITTVKAYDARPESQKAYVEEMGKKFKFNVVGVGSPKEAVISSDVVVTAVPIAKDPQPVIEDSWLKPGALAAPVDLDTLWKAEVMQKVDKFCVDDTPQILRFKSEGYLKSLPEIYADLGEIVAKKKPGRQNDKERIMSMNLGLALEDVAVAIHIYQTALEKGIGRKLPL
jgi:ornithine cyclodeaminase/alanine dehydrogenase